ncbi:MAG TPA: S9 family peptidase [Terriglobales bacterium]
MKLSRNFLTFLLLAVSVIAQAQTTAITDPKQIKSKSLGHDVQPLSIEKLYMTRAIGGTTWSPDGKQVAFVTNISGRNNLWIVPTEGGWPVQLTVSDQRQTQPTWSPDGRWIVYSSDYDGNEQWDLFVVSPQTGEVVNLTNTPEIAEQNPAWSYDGKSLAYIVKPQTSPSYEIFVMNMLTRRGRPLTSGTAKELGNYGPVWSRDGKFIAYTQEHANGANSNIFLVDVASGKSTNVTPHNGNQRYSAEAISPDGKQVLITSNAGNGYDNVGLLDIASKKIDWLTQDKWKISAGGFSPDGKLITWTANIDGETSVFFYDTATKQAAPLPLPPGVNSLGGSETAFTKDGARLLYYHNGPTAPNDAWVYDIASKQSRQVTHSLVGGINTAEMVEPFLVHYPSQDGKWTISALAYIPHNAPRDGRRPLIVYIHGGPQSQTVNSFNRIIQYLVNQGYAVVAPNYRGSTGYGKDFMEADRFDMGGGDLKDNLAAVGFMMKSGYIDSKKLVVMGGSYGGYMTMMAVTKEPEMWAAGVPIVPFVNWFTEVEHEDPVLQQGDLATMGDPVKNKTLWEDRSPINFVDRIKAPLLLLAGGNDPRCPKSEAQQVADAIKKRNGVVEFKIYENEGHGFARVENQIDAYKRVADFLKKHVPAPDCGCSLFPEGEQTVVPR